MAAAPLPLSLDEYVRTSYKPDVDFVDGPLQQQSVGIYEHGRIQGWILHLFMRYAREWKTDQVVEQRIRVRNEKVRVCNTPICLDLTEPFASLDRA